MREIKEEIEEKLNEVMFDLLKIPKTKSNEDTPKRIAKMWTDELFVNRNGANIKELEKKIKTFPNEYDHELIVVKDIPFNSTCEHHWLPFSGKVTIGYVPKDKVLGLSKLPRIVKYFSKMPQLQEKLTKDIMEFVKEVSDPLAVFIDVEAEHQCVKCRGAESDCATHTNISWYSETLSNSERITYKKDYERRK